MSDHLDHVKADVAHALHTDRHDMLRNHVSKSIPWLIDEIERLREQLSAAIDAHDDLQTISGGYKAERDTAVAKVERVEALIAEAESGGLSWGGFVRDVGAALRGEGA